MGTEVRNYKAAARSTDVFGRVLCSAREQHFVIDGPSWNGCPAEALTPGEAFLAAIAACGVELVQVLAAADGLEVGPVDVAIGGAVDPDDPVRGDMTVFNRVRMTFAIAGVSEAEAQRLVQGVARRCPLYGSVAASARELDVEVRAS
ncbi:MAG TPA: OsmC family protein [Solirubrobacteraceae bacterium]|nr:OsmC family protein [Solirubrobacteraceae bacterium]